MQATVQRETLLERRAHNNVTEESLWSMLSLSQNFAANSLTKLGYKLSYIRNSKTGSLAIMLRNGDFATISVEGEIDSSPHINIRF